MKYQPDCEHIVRSTTSIKRPLALARQIAAIAHEVYAELKRLNHGGEYRGMRTTPSRRKQSQAFKAALAQRYREHNHCC